MELRSTAARDTAPGDKFHLTTSTGIDICVANTESFLLEKKPKGRPLRVICPGCQGRFTSDDGNARHKKSKVRCPYCDLEFSHEESQHSAE